MVQKEPELDIRYSDVVATMQDDFVRKGLMKPVHLQQITDGLASQVAAYKQVYGGYLRSEWPTLFPDVTFTERLLQKKLDGVLTRKQQEVLDEIKKQLERHKMFKLFFKWVFRKWDFRLLFSVVVSCFTIPVLLKLFFTPNDAALTFGFWGLLANIVLIIFMFYKSHQSKKLQNKQEYAL